MNATKQNWSICICGPLHLCVWNEEFFFLFYSSFLKIQALLEEKNSPEKVTYISLVFLRNKVQTSQKNTGECSTTKLISTSKNSGTLEGKKIHLKKSLRSVSHQAIQLSTLHVF